MDHFLITPEQLKKIIRESAAMGAAIALTKTGKLRPYLKKREAFRLYGQGNVERWIAEGHITIRKDGNHTAAWRIDRLELEAVIHAMELWRNL